MMFIRLIVTLFLIVGFSSGARAQCDGTLIAGLVGHWKLDETSGTLADSSGFGHNGTASGGISYGSAGVLGKAVYFDGDDDEIGGIGSPTTLDDIDSQGDGMTLSAWVNQETSSTDNYRRILQKGSFNVSSGEWSWGISNSNGVTFRKGFDGGILSISTPDNVITNNDWYHVLVTWDGNADSGSVRIYVDGEEIASSSQQAIGNKLSDAPETLFIGAGSGPSTGRSFHGALDDVRIYNRVLNSSEVKRLSRLNAGDIRFNGNSASVEYCDGVDWVMAGTGSFSPTAAAFDGTDYLTYGSEYIGVTDGTQISASFWTRFNSYPTSTTYTILSSNPSRIRIYYGGGGTETMQMLLQDSSNSHLVNIGCGPDPHEVGVWYHHLISVDVGTGVATCYVDGADSMQTFTAPTNGAIDFTIASNSVGANTTGSLPLDGQIADLWIDFGNYIDFSSADQRAKFRSPTGVPMYLGPDGSLPTGYAPDIFLSGDVETWHINKGTGGGFVENGELTYFTNEPGHPYNDMPMNGLVGWWRLDETSGTSVIDYASANDGTWRGSLTVKPTGGVFGGAQYFAPQSSNEVDLGRPIDLDMSGSNAFTIAAWVKPETSGVVFSRGAVQSSANNTVYLLRRYNLDPTRWNLGVSDGSMICDAFSPPGSVEPGVWQYIVGTWDGISLTIYKDGVNIGGQNCSAGAFTSLWDGGGTNVNRDTSIGADARSDRYYWNGSIDEVAVYNRALSQPEIQAIYDAAFCENPTDRIGSIIYNTDQLVMQFCNGKDWVAMGPVGGTGGGGCVNPAGNAGDLMFNDVFNVLQFCNSQDWVGIGKQVPPTDGLIAHWTLDEALSPFADTANGNTASEVGSVQLIETRNRGGQLCGDTLGYISAPSTNDYRDLRAFTFAAWVRPDFVDNHHGIIEIVDLATLRFPFQQQYIGFIASAWNGGIGAWNATSYPLDLGAWTHVAVTYNYNSPVGTEPNIYINGVLQTSLGVPFSPSGTVTPPADGTLHICARDVSGIRRLEGGIDDVRVYDRILNPSEITQLYLATR
ncbi:MAG: LamG domain-containing protein [Heliomarina sp.]|uniref:LamG domain-containing protein n=1 Tax=Heliomarina sp. TaxID=2917556 RepID=UPI004058D8FD